MLLVFSNWQNVLGQRKGTEREGKVPYPPPNSLHGMTEKKENYYK